MIELRLSEAISEWTSEQVSEQASQSVENSTKYKNCSNYWNELGYIFGISYFYQYWQTVKK